MAGRGANRTGTGSRHPGRTLGALLLHVDAHAGRPPGPARAGDHRPVHGRRRRRARRCRGGPAGREPSQPQGTRWTTASTRRATATVTGNPDDFGEHVDQERELYWGYKFKDGRFVDGCEAPECPRKRSSLLVATTGCRRSSPTPPRTSGTRRGTRSPPAAAVPHRRDPADGPRDAGGAGGPRHRRRDPGRGHERPIPRLQRCRPHRDVRGAVDDETRTKVNSSADGGNAQIAEVAYEPPATELPAEYALLQATPHPLTPEDIVATGVLMTRFVASEGKREMTWVRALLAFEGPTRSSSAGRSSATSSGARTPGRPPGSCRGRGPSAGPTPPPRSRTPRSRPWRTSATRCPTTSTAALAPTPTIVRPSRPTAGRGFGQRDGPARGRPALAHGAGRGGPRRLARGPDRRLLAGLDGPVDDGRRLDPADQRARARLQPDAAGKFNIPGPATTPVGSGCPVLPSSASATPAPSRGR